ncbi:NADH-quinone oxidoreductase subunit L [Mycolicibacterium sp. GF69]|uniref:proton-conducting transporter transmembrane domain-containing protein n=1 Tax=Mycolicibacterium sp. GF69 TaxID=2267251 RepID=UPI000DCD84F5|nr:proton-conducting transporter membrane subunit [Mycolicibacterium sp. GF69]RAV06921.1 NADH-quinone oxidoreductase subunit L [Mycolicibacterium sp. GF69]
MTSATHLALWALIGMPAIVGAGLLLSPLCGRDLGRAAAAISVTVSAAVLALAVWVAVARPAVGTPFVAGAEFSLRIDGLAAAVVPAVAAVTLLVLVFAGADSALAGGRFHGLMLVFASAAVLTATASSMPALLLAWEVMGAASYALIGFHWRDEQRVSAGLTAFVTTRSADLGLYLAAGAALAGGAGLALADLPAADARWRHVIALGVLIAALGKAAQVPFSFWLSRAMQGPSPVSALLHSAAMVAMGAYLLLRTAPLLAATGWAATAAVWAGAATAVLLGVVAVAQRDLKQLLAASTSAQLGFVVMAAGLATVSGGAAQLIAHASTKAGLFLAAGAWLSLLGSQRFGALPGAARRWPLLRATATVSALALAGIAPLSMWATKDAVLAAALERSPWLYGAGMMAAALSAAYAAKLVMVLWRNDSAPDEPVLVEEVPRNPARLSVFEQVPLVVLAMGAVVAGALALPPIGTWLARDLDGAETPHAAIVELTASAVLAVVVVLAVLRWGVPESRWAAGWLGLERAADVVLVRPTLALSATLARFDDHVLDRAIDAAATGTVQVAHFAGRVDTRGVDAVVETVASRMRRLGALARKPQSGQLHQYYAVAVIVLVLGVLLLVVVR